MKHDRTPIQPSLTLAAIALLIVPCAGVAEFHSNLPLIDDDPDQSVTIRALADPCRESVGEDLPPWFWSWLRSYLRERFDEGAAPRRIEWVAPAREEVGTERDR